MWKQVHVNINSPSTDSTNLENQHLFTHRYSRVQSIHVNTLPWLVRQTKIVRHSNDLDKISSLSLYYCIYFLLLQTIRLMGKVAGCRIALFL